MKNTILTIAAIALLGGGYVALQWAAENFAAPTEGGDLPWITLSLIFAAVVFATPLLVAAKFVYDDWGTSRTPMRYCWDEIKRCPLGAVWWWLCMPGLLVATPITLLAAAFFYNAQLGWVIGGLLAFFSLGKFINNAQLNAFNQRMRDNMEEKR